MNAQHTTATVHTYIGTVCDPNDGTMWEEKRTIKAASPEEALAKLHRWAVSQELFAADGYSVGDELQLQVVDELGRSSLGIAVVDEVTGEDTDDE